MIRARLSLMGRPKAVASASPWCGGLCVLVLSFAPSALWAAPPKPAPKTGPAPASASASASPTSSDDAISAAAGDPATPHPEAPAAPEQRLAWLRGQLDGL